MATEPRFKIGSQFWSRGKVSHLCTITDILRTTNSAGELVKLRYVATHEFMGHLLEDNDVCETTIAISITNQEA